MLSIEDRYFSTNMYVCTPANVVFCACLWNAGSENNMGLDMLMNMFGGLGAGSLTTSNVPDG